MDTLLIAINFNNLMLVYILLGIAAVGILIIYGQRFLKELHRKKILKQTTEMLPDAVSEFESLCNPGRQFLDEEVNSYKDKYADLYSVVNTFSATQIDLFIERLNTTENSDIALRFSRDYTDIQSKQSSNNKIHALIDKINKEADELYSRLTSLFPESITVESYLRYSEVEPIISRHESLLEAIKSVYPDYNQYLTFSAMDALADMALNLEQKRLDYNHDVYIPHILNEYKSYFDTLLQYPLDPQQRNAIVTDEDNILVLSSAGSGKTSTIIGKARYLLDKHKVDPKRLLILTYTRKAATELVERLGNDDVDCTTFHSLAVRIIAQIEHKRPSICEPSLLLNIFRKLIKTDDKFREAVLNYILHLQSLMKLEHEYDKYPDYFADRKKYGIQAPYSDYKDNIIFTRSEEEKRICTFLTELGVNFLYEEPYEFTTYTPDHRQYKPDFTIIVNEPYTDPNTGVTSSRKRRVYLEHFAINDKGDVPKWFGDKDPVGGWYLQNKLYKSGIVWKRDIHKQKGTVLIETKSADFHSGKILDVLKEQLAKAGVPVNPVSSSELYDRLVKRSKKIESSVFKLLEQFIILLKSNSGSIQPFIDKAKTDNDERTLAILTEIVKPLLNDYTEELMRRREIDFTDAINDATNYCASNLWINYDYILVDEFQDISVDRYNFLQFLRTKNPLTKLFCVGDDWQSIYRFAGSNMKLIYKFEDYFGYTEYCKIESTYRFFNPLLSKSSDFIQRNPNQLRKDIKSISASNRTLYDLHDCGYSENNNGGMLKVASILVSHIPTDETILILGRYNYDVRSLGYDTSKHDFDKDREIINVDISGRTVRFMSVHAAKGLEADNVILINCNAGAYGFPSLIEDDPILDYVLSDEDKYEYAEERRLFYVALTRAKKHLHILYNGDRPSPFVKELTDDVKSNVQICPVCQEGHIVVIKNAVASNGTKYINYGCSNANSGCEYFERVFGNQTPSLVNFNEKLRANKKT